MHYTVHGVNRHGMDPTSYMYTCDGGGPGGIRGSPMMIDESPDIERVVEEPV